MCKISKPLKCVLTIYPCVRIIVTLTFPKRGVEFLGIPRLQSRRCRVALHPRPQRDFIFFGKTDNVVSTHGLVRIRSIRVELGPRSLQKGLRHSKLRNFWRTPYKLSKRFDHYIQLIRGDYLTTWKLFAMKYLHTVPHTLYTVPATLYRKTNFILLKIGRLFCSIACILKYSDMTLKYQSIPETTYMAQTKSMDWFASSLLLEFSKWCYVRISFSSTYNNFGLDIKVIEIRNIRDTHPIWKIGPIFLLILQPKKSLYDNKIDAHIVDYKSKLK